VDVNVEHMRGVVNRGACALEAAAREAVHSSAWEWQHSIHEMPRADQASQPTGGPLCSMLPQLHGLGGMLTCS
jgi:hypothetical protein